MPLPESATQRLMAVQPTTFPCTRLIGENEFHLTLHFLGPLSPAALDQVRTALQSLIVKALSISIRGIGHFPIDGPPRVLWAGVEKTSALNSLYQEIKTTLLRITDVKLDDRPYFPHITLARLNTPAPTGTVQSYLNSNQDFHIPVMMLNQYVLYSSELTNHSPKYQEVCFFDLS